MSAARLEATGVRPLNHAARGARGPAGVRLFRYYTVVIPAS
jgi:hypothetical protein